MCKEEVVSNYTRSKFHRYEINIKLLRTVNHFLLMKVAMTELKKKTKVEQKLNPAFADKIIMVVVLDSNPRIYDRQVVSLVCSNMTQTKCYTYTTGY